MGSRWGKAGVLLAAGLVLAGCSLVDPGGVAGSAGPVSSVGSPRAGDEPAVATAGGLPVLDTRETADGGDPVLVELNDLSVRGQIMFLTMTARNAAPGGATPTDAADNWAPETFFDDRGDPVFSNISADGIHLVDTVNAERYLTGRNPDGICLCTDLDGVSLEPGQGVVLSVAFAAPPPDVTAFDVVVPGVDPFTGVRVNR